MRAVALLGHVAGNLLEVSGRPLRFEESVAAHILIDGGGGQRRRGQGQDGLKDEVEVSSYLKSEPMAKDQ